MGTSPPAEERKVGSVQIFEASLRGYSVSFAYEIFKGGGLTDKIKIKSDAVAHKDLRDAFSKLVPHLAVICEEIEPKKIVDIDNIAKYDDKLHKDGSLEHKVSHFRVRSFRLKGKGENQGISISGTKRLSTGDHIGLNTPFVKWDSMSYSFLDDLRMHAVKLQEEVDLYRQGKVALEQPELDFGAGEGESEDDFEDK